MLYRIIIKCILRYLDLPKGEFDKNVDNFLVSSWTHPGFRKYLADRDEKIIYELAGGVGMKEKSREDYIRLCGQRVENLILGVKAKGASARRDKNNLSTGLQNKSRHNI